MKWLDMLVELAGPVVGVVKAIAGDRWDQDKAEAVLKGLARNPPRQAVSDEDRARLEALAEGE